MLDSAFANSACDDLRTLRGENERMNKVFKFSLQTWIPRPSSAPGGARLLWISVAQTAAVLAGWFASSSLVRRSSVRRHARPSADRFALLPRTLDGLASHETAVYNDEHGPIPLHWDAEAMRWFQENVDGLLSSLRARRRSTAGPRHPSTPVAHILGWDRHETQQRPGARPIEERKRDIAALYTSADPQVARQVLQHYNVRYLIVGPVERLYYPATGLAVRIDAGAAGGA
jgi:uncharacterized membrane protein